MKPIDQLTDKEIDRLIFNCRRALASQKTQLKFSTDADMQAAYETALGTLRDLYDVAPAHKRTKIQALLNRHGVGVRKI